MNYSQQFDQIVNFIKSDFDIWYNEILDLIPQRLEVFKKPWVMDLKTLSLEQLWQVDCFQKTELLPEGEFKEWLDQLTQLSKLPKFEYGQLDELTPWAFLKIKFKKKHEIQIIAQLIKKIKQDHNFSHLVDIGGGIGNLSRVLAHHYNTECISLDINEEFQKIGRTKLAKSIPPKTDFKNVTFINHDFTNPLDEDVTKKIFTPQSFSLGLHTCGPLAVKHIQVATDNHTKGFLNFGCCYYKLDTTSEINLSKHASKHGLKLSQYSCTLAARGHSSMDFDGFKLKKRVKDFRYAIHLLMTREMGLPQIISVGEGDAKEYWGKFSDYVLPRFERLKINHSFSAEYLDQYFNAPKLQEYLHELYLCNVIRWQFGRALELYILLDRCMYLEEKGYSPLLHEYFDPLLSPRNIGLLVLN